MVGVLHHLDMEAVLYPFLLFCAPSNKKESGKASAPPPPDQAWEAGRGGLDHFPSEVAQPRIAGGFGTRKQQGCGIFLATQQAMRILHLGPKLHRMSSSRVGGGLFIVAYVQTRHCSKSCAPQWLLHKLGYGQKRHQWNAFAANFQVHVQWLLWVGPSEGE